MFKHYLIKRSLVSGLVVAAVSFPSAAQAMFIDGGGGRAPIADHPSTAPSAPAASSSGGFHWGDAGIGAAGAVVLLGGAAAGAGVTRRQRIQRRVAG